MKINRIIYFIILGIISIDIKYCLGTGDDAAAAGDAGAGNCDVTKTPACGHVPDASGLIGGKKVDKDTPPSGSVPGNTTQNKELKGSELIELGCIFNEREDLGIQPFSKIKKEEETCDIRFKNETDAFMYSCDGTSDPQTCPMEVKVEEGVVKLDTLFTQATITNQSANYTGNPNIFHVVTGKAQKDFVAVCECTRKDGKKDTMKLISSFKQVGILGVIGIFIIILMK